MRSRRAQTSIFLPLSISAIFLSASLVLAKEEILVDVDSDAGLNTAQIIQARGYEVELHKITTADRYVLTMHRIPKSYDETQSGFAAATNKPVVILQHGLLDSSYTWVLNYRDQSLAFILADLGYDVWLGNIVGFSHDQKLAKSVSYFGALTPVAWTGDATSPIFVALAKMQMDTWAQVFGMKEFLPNNPLLQNLLGSTVCAWANEVCSGFFDLIGGPSDNVNSSRVHVYVTQTPAGSSAKNVAHYAQGIRDNTFASYDYGCNCDPSAGVDACSEFECINKVKYGSLKPPAFPIQNMVHPRTGFYNGARDTLATQADINKLRAGLPRGTVVFDKMVDFGHLDFTWASNAHENVYNDLIQQIRQYEGRGY
ncbi:hypothetical protein PR003_g13072 [Phytophthora rubi]|uniref:Lipase n=1 Tax=Phytophthora rubi TaxID=129364 RepID=A0A6A4FGG2_9STRA|nr:hypothetical protein PR001_g12466 [Phytophthora rubi]KAE9335309.1 hypothetical protein PR003_g13072 [Phytophthora rubi]